MSRFLRFCAFLSVLFFATNVFASGYTCPSYKRYTSCNSGYYLNGTSAGNSCDLCPSGCTCSGGTAQPDCSIRVTYNLNGGSGTTPSATQCISGVSCMLRSGVTTSFYRAGYVFKGWATSSTATTGSASITVTASTTVYAVWSKCGTGTYKTSSAQASASCSSCPDGYKSGSGTTAQSNCTASCEAGYAVVSEGGACTSIQDDNHVGIYTTSHTVKYGELSTLNRCPQGYIYNLGTTAQSNCRTLCSAGYAVLSANDRCRKIDSMQGVYTPEHFVYYGDKSEIVSCPTGYQAGNGTTAKEECIASCEAGSAVVKEHAECTSIQTNDYLGIYTEAHTVKYGALSTLTMCEDGYQDGKGAKSQFGCIASCKAGYAVLGQGGPCTSIQNSTYKGKYITAHKVNYGGTSTINDCPTNYQAGNGTTAQSNCTTSCSAGYAVLSANGACTTIQNATYKGKYRTAHTVKYGRKSTISTCPTNYQAGNGTTAKEECITSCSAGYAVLSANGACESIMDDTAYTGQYTDDHTVKYGGKTEILVCPDGYRDRLTGSESKTGCQATCPAGYAVINPGLGCVNIMNDEYTGQYTDEHNVKYEETSEIQMCPDPYRAGKGAKTISGCLADCQAGYAVLTAGGACTSIQNSTYKGKFTPYHMVNYGYTTLISTCPTNYQAGDGTTAQSNCTTSCSAGYAVLSANGACTTIQNATYKGKYITAHTVKYGGKSTINDCPTNYQAGNGTTAQSNCTTSCSAGYAVLSANGACTTIQNATYKGKYITAHTVKYGGKSTINDCPTNYQAGNGTTAKAYCKITCPAGYAVLEGEGPCESIMDDVYTGVYTDEHTLNYNEKTELKVCPDGYQDGKGAATQAGCQIACPAGYAVLEGEGACESIMDEVHKGRYTDDHLVSYGDRTEIKMCPTGYQDADGTKSQNDCTALCDAGYAVLSEGGACTTIQNATYKGKYTTAHGVNYGATSSISTCPTNYQAGNGTTAQSNCTTSCAAGTRVASAKAACSAVTSGNVYMLAHTVKYGLTSAAATSCPSGYTISGTTQSDHDAKADCKITCSAGTRVASADASCSSISSSTGYYITGHTVSAGTTSPAATQCPANYRSGAGTTAESNCTTSCAAGTRVASAKAACSAVTSGNVYMLAHTVKYGLTSAAATSCPSGYTISGTTQSDHDAKADCKITCSAGTRVASADASCSSISSSTGYYITGHTVSAGTTSPAATQCPANYRSGAGTTSQADCSLTTTAGKYVASPGAGETACVSPYFCPGGVIIKYGTGTTTGGYKYCTDLGTIYTKSDAGASVNTKCYATTTSKKWIASAKATAETDCTAGYYCEGGTKVYYNSTGGRAQCTAGNYCPAGSNAMSSCSALVGGLYKNSVAGSDAAEDCYFNTTGGKYLANATDTAQTTCPAKSYCPTTTLYYPNVGGSKTCPDPTSSTYKETLAEMDWLTERCPTATTSNSSLTTSSYQTWGNTGLSAITQCPATMSVSTPCANFSIESAKYNSTTKRYNSDSGSVYANSVKKGYYLYEQHNSTYCNNAGSGSTKRMLMRKAAVCPENSYCPGGTVPLCNSGTYVTEYGKYACTSLGSFYTTSDVGAESANKCYGTTTAGKYIKTQNNSTQETCPAGSYCPATVVFYSQYDTSGGRTACPAGTKNASTGSTASSACTTCAAGTYNTTTGNASCSNCGTGYYCTGGSARAQCTTTSGWTTTTSTDKSTSYSACYQTQTPSGCASGTIKRTASSISGTTITYGSASVSTSLSAKANYYVSGTSCPVCTGLGSFYTTSAGGAINSSKCYGTTTAGKYIKTQNSSTQETCPAGSYCPATTVYYGKYDTSGGRVGCGAGKYNASTGSSASSACANITAGCYGTSASTACPAVCGTNQYSTAGSSSCSSCPADYKNSGTTAASHAGSASCIITVSGGYYIGTAGDNSSNWDKCAGGTYKAQHTVKYGDISSCGQCPANSYCPAGASAATACSTLASGFYPNSAAGSDAATDCKTNNLSGKYVASANATSATSCAAGTYKGAHQVNYGSTSSCGTCPANSYCTAGASAATACSTLASGFYPNSAAGSDAATDCKTNSLSGKYVASVNATSATSCAAGTYKGSHQVNYGSTSSCGTCPANSYCPAGASAATACSTLASGFYPNSAAGSDASTDCYTNSLNGKYVASAKAATLTVCAAGTFKGAHQVNYGSTSSCDSCALGSYSAAGASACTACQNGKTTSGTGKSSCDATCANNNSYDSTWATATWSDNAVANLCQITTCAGGSRYTSAKGEATGTLPSGYTQLAYLESTGTQYIDTGVVGKSGISVDALFVANDTTSGSLFGNRMSGNTRFWPALWISSSGKSRWAVTVNTDTFAGTFEANTLYRTSFFSDSNGWTFSVNGKLVSYGAGVNTSNTNNMYMFGTNNNNSSTLQYPFKGKAYFAQIYEKGVLIKHLIPAMRDSDGVLGMYDTVNNKFLANSGTGKFVAGPIILKSQNTCTQCSAGTYSAGGTATSCETCANWTYSSAGAASCTACLAVPDAVGGVAWTKASGTGWDAFNDCVVTQTPVNCASGSVKRTQSSTSAWGNTTLVTALKSNAGYYASTSATSCTICPAGSYCAANATAATPCAAGSYTSATGKSACTACTAGKTTSGTGKTSCDATCDNATGAHTWATPSWSANSVSNLCTVSKCNANTYYTATTGTGYKNTCTACGSNSSTSAGNTSTTCTCTTGYTSTGGVSGATTSKSGCSLISDIACAIGEYVPASSTTCSACTAGYYCPSTAKTYSYSSSIQGRTACSAGTYQPDTGKTSCTPASKGYYVSGTAKTKQTACTGATYAANTGQASCTACPTPVAYPGSKLGYYWDTTGLHTSEQGCHATIANPTISNGTLTATICYLDKNGDYGTADALRGSWGCEARTTNMTCNGGYYTTKSGQFAYISLQALAANVCTAVGAGYWSANDSLTRTACTSPLTTIGYGTAANEVEDCGRKLHAGANVIYLRSAQRSSPSLRVKVGDTTFYGALSTSLSSPLKVKNGSTTYSVVNDWQ